ncbi:MAG TPA: AI-2E family transporter [Verrucomicrobia bacterium]|nr:MAG: AI-2E family transporter [Lentisphaerae bacterium GWF2_57_35]HBA86226.1 AI-2E family transporter [Verrucomicrobiota bacterium]
MEKSRIVIVLLAVLALVAVGVVLKSAQSVILPLILAWLLSYILGPVVGFLTRRRIPAPIAVGIVLVLLIGLCYVGVVFVNARISTFITAYPKYHAKITQFMQAMTSSIDMPSNPLAKIDWGQKFSAFLISLSGFMVVFVSKLVMVIIFLVFMLLGKPFFQYKVRKAFRPEYAVSIEHVMNTISGQIGRYLTVQVLVSFVTGVLVWLALSWLGVDFALTWGALAFFLNFVPTVGSIAASIPPILLALVQYYPNYWVAAICTICLLAIHMSLGHLVVPKVMGDRLNLSPVVVLLSLVFWGWLWGIVGALISIPIAAAIKIVCENVEPLHPIGVLMGSGGPIKKEMEAAGR